MSEQDLQELEYLGAQFTPTDELAAIIGLPFNDLQEELLAVKTPRAKAILTGRFTRKTALRESILDMACRGSSPAQAEALRMLKDL